MEWLSENIGWAMLGTFASTLAMGIIVNLISPSAIHYTKIPFIRFKSKRVAWKRDHLKYISQLSINRNLSQLLSVKIKACFSQALLSLVLGVGFTLMCNQWLVGQKLSPKDPIMLTSELMPFGLLIGLYSFMVIRRLSQASDLFRMLEHSVLLELNREQNTDGYYKHDELDTVTDDQINELYNLLNGSFWKRFLRKDGLAV